MADEARAPEEVLSRSLATRYFLCGDLLVAAALFAVVAGLAPLVGHVQPGDSIVSVLGAVLFSGGVPLAAWGLLRLPSRSEQREHGTSGTGFAEVHQVRRLLRERADLTPAQREVADDLDAVCRRRERSLKAKVAVIVVGAAVLVFAVIHGPKPVHDEVPRLLGAAALVVVFLVDQARARSVGADLRNSRE